MKIPFGKFEIRTHQEGNIFIYGSAVLSCLSLIFTGISVLTLLFLIFSGACIGFFRDPVRVTKSVHKQDIFSAADGIVTKIAKDSEYPAELDMKKGSNPTKVSVFLSVFNVHVNRIPVSGKITKTKYHKGLFLNASLDKSSDKNERNSVVVCSDNGDNVVMVQIAGLIARRIICDCEVGSFLDAGQRFGIIKFGSRVDLYIPKKYKLNVSVGQTVVGGETIVAFLDK